jgi:hypothetical protein
VGASTSHNPVGFHGPLQWQLYLFYLYKNAPLVSILSQMNSVCILSSHLRLGLHSSLFMPFFILNKMKVGLWDHLVCVCVCVYHLPLYRRSVSYQILNRPYAVKEKWESFSSQKLSSWYSNQKHVCIFLLLSYACYVPWPLYTFDLIIPIMVGKEYVLWSSLFWSFIRYHIISSLLDANESKYWRDCKFAPNLNVVSLSVFNSTVLWETILLSSNKFLHIKL